MPVMRALALPADKYYVARGDKARLQPIRGLPPDLIDPPDACPFAPRCSFARDACRQARPPLQEVGGGHLSACWFWEDVSPKRSAELATGGVV